MKRVALLDQRIGEEGSFIRRLPKMVLDCWRLSQQYGRRCSSRTHPPVWDLRTRSRNRRASQERAETEVLRPTAAGPCNPARTTRTHRHTRGIAEASLAGYVRRRR